jgi:6-phosphogluconolactonase (cycloisomerase 2 family)
MPSRSTLSNSMARLIRWGRVASLAVGLSAGFLTGITRAQVSPPKGVVYVESNVADAPGNQILAYKRDDAGKLTPIKGSPFSAGGAGISLSFALGPFDSDQEIITNPDKTLLFATNGGSSSIAVFSFTADGSLVPVDGSPFFSGGSNPVSVGISGDTLIAVNQDNDPGNPGLFGPNYASLKIKSDGTLVPIKGSVVPLDLGSSPSQALVAPTNSSLAFGCDFLGGLLHSFQLNAKGQLVPVEVQALPAAEFALTGAPALPLGLWAHPKRKILYVGFVTINRIGVYRFNDQGQLKFLRTVPDSGNGVCWLRTNKEGTRLYASNTGDPSISVYDISTDPTEPIEIQKVVLNGTSNVFQITLDPAEEFFYAVTQRASATAPASANALHVLTIDENGLLTEVPSSPTLLPVPASSRPQGVLAF